MSKVGDVQKDDGYLCYLLSGKAPPQQPQGSVRRKEKRYLRTTTQEMMDSIMIAELHGTWSGLCCVKGVRESESRTGTRLVSPGHRPKKKIPTPLQTGFKTDFKKF